MDVLSDVLSALRVKGTLSRRSEYTAPWGVAFEANDLASFLIIERGSCAMSMDQEPPVILEAGDLVMFAPGGASWLADQPSTQPVPYARVRAQATLVEEDDAAPMQDSYPTLRYGGGGRATTLLAWGLRFEGRDHHALLSLLPRFVHLSYEERSSWPWLETTLRFLLHETRDRRQGSDILTLRLIELLFVQITRAWFEQQPEGEAGWVGALRDPSIGQALQLMHRRPAHDWTVDTLASAIGMSRSSFAAHFQSLVGSPPMRYLTQLRMNMAANALTTDAGASLAQVASDVGYDSESSFGRAFKRHFGRSPGAFRRGR